MKKLMAVRYAALILFVLAGAVLPANGAALENLAPKARVSATSEAGETNLARFAIDGRIPPEGSMFADGYASWAVNGKATGNKGSFILEWTEPVTAAEIIYYGRTAWGKECFKDYEVTLDDAKAPAARGSLKAVHGPQRIKFREATVRKITIKFLNAHPKVPNAGASEIMVLSTHPTEKTLKRFLAFRPNPVFSRNMVLQRGREVPVWGTAANGEKVTVSYRDQKVTTTAKKGRWMARLKPMKVGKPGELVIETAFNAFRMKNVVVGEVWIASGQSNMAMPVAPRSWPGRYSGVTNFGSEVASARYPDIRLCFVNRKASAFPKTETENGPWNVCSPKTVGGYTAIGYFFARHLHKELKVPVGVIDASWGATAIEPWISKRGAASVPGLREMTMAIRKADADFKRQAASGKTPAVNWQFQPTVLYRSMIRPLIPLAISGAIWYQGEGNLGQGMAYYRKMKALIGGWRSAWGQGKFPFLFVQLAPFNYNGDPYRLQSVWEAQRLSLSIPNTGMAVTTDISDVNNIHPPNKQDVGKRLALWALAKTYGQKDLVCSGPLYKSMKVKGNKIVVTFDHIGGGLASRNRSPLDWFEVAGRDKKFHKANAKISGKTVIVSSGQVRRPVAVRFGWNKIANPNLMNKEGLPASPFRTDRW